jgi:chemotaxis protein MotA
LISITEAFSSNFFKFDFIIILFAIFNYLYLLNIKSGILIYLGNKKSKFSIFSDLFFSYDKLKKSEILIILESKFSFFISFSEIFPLLGILGTIIGLLTLKDFNNVSENFSISLTSTFWGIIFAMFFKIQEGVLSKELIKVDKNIVNNKELEEKKDADKK